MHQLRFQSLLFVALGVVAGCVPGRSSQTARTSATAEENAHARQILCRDIGERVCLDKCGGDVLPAAHVDCLLRLRFDSDREALRLARMLYRDTNALIGPDKEGTIGGYHGEEDIQLFPALPVGDHRHHLAWLHASYVAFDDFVESLNARTQTPVQFRARPRGVVFFQTAELRYPSAYFLDGIIGYNIQGPLNADPRDMRETFFHELFHANDLDRGEWSVSTLGPLFDSIIARCGDDHDCFSSFAPHDTIVPNGTYYAFDARTRDVREYAAELALRYFVEHEAVLAGQPPRDPAFKCITVENRLAWEHLARAFFGGVDLTPACDAPATDRQPDGT